MPSEEKNSNATMIFIASLILGLVPWGLGLIGVTANLYLGAFILAVAFGLGVRAFWIWERASSWHVTLRICTVLVGFCVYSYLIGGQIRRQYRAEHLNPDQESSSTLRSRNPGLTCKSMLELTILQLSEGST